MRYNTRRIDDGIRAGRGSTARRAGLEADEESGALPRLSSQVAQRLHLRMGATGRAMKPLRHDLSMLHHQGPDHWVGMGSTPPLTGQLKAPLKEAADVLWLKVHGKRIQARESSNPTGQWSEPSHSGRI